MTDAQGPSGPPSGIAAALGSLDGEALNRDIKMLVGLLGETLVRHEGQELFDLVERVRTLSKATRSTRS